MNLKRPSLAVLCMATTFSLQAAAPPKKSGPSLQETMEFIQDRMIDNRHVGFVATVQSIDGSTHEDTFVEEFSNDRADARACVISRHRKLTYKGAPSADNDTQTSLVDAEDVVVEPEAQALSAQYASGGFPDWTVPSTNPSITLVVVRHPNHNMDYWLEFSNATLADRVAKAVTHAIELCGGGNKAPF